MEILKFIKNLMPYIVPYKTRIFGTIILSFFLAIFKAAQAYLVKPIFDNGLSESSTFSNAWMLASCLLLILIANFPCRFYHFYWIRYVVDRATCRVRLEMYKKMQNLPLSFYVKNKQGILISNLLNDTHTFSQGFKGVIDLVREPLTAIFMLALAFYRDWQLTMIILVVSPLFIWIFNSSGKKVRINQGDVQEELGNMTHIINEGLSGQKILKAFNIQDFILKRFKKSQDKYFGSLMKTTWVEEFAHPLVEMVGGLAFSGIIVFAHFRIKSGAMTAGDFVSFLTAMALFMDPVRKYSQANIKLNQAKAAANRIFGLLDFKEEIDNGNKTIMGFETKIEIKNLTFSYGEGEVIKDLSMEIKKGQKVGLVGLSGSGKSTLINLLLGLYTVKPGSIFINDISIENIKLSSLRNLFSLVSQDIFLFNDTVSENLSIGNIYNEEELNNALEIAYADKFVKKLPDRLDTFIGDRGTKLSGGQQQRLTISRACLRNADILLFDEATSALDNESEKIVQKAMDKVAGDKTVIAVAHRLSTIQDYDQIFVFHEGRLVESGNHEYLMSLSGEYSKLYELSQKS